VRQFWRKFNRYQQDLQSAIWYRINWQCLQQERCGGKAQVNTHMQNNDACVCE